MSADKTIAKLARVFVVNDNRRFDLSTVKDHGELVFLMQQRATISPFRTEEALDLLIKRFKEEQYDPMLDLVAMSGASLYLALITFAATTFTKDGQFRALLFDAGKSNYVERIFRNPSQ